MLWFSSFIQVIFTSQVVFNLPSGIAVTGVPLQSFLLAACWHSNSCSCFARIDFPRTAPSKAYLQATALQQNINAVSFSAVSFFQKKKKTQNIFSKAHHGMSLIQSTQRTRCFFVRDYMSLPLPPSPTAWEKVLAQLSLWTRHES